MLLVLANGLLSGAEIAIVALRRTRIRELVAAGSGAARALEALRENPEKFLATVQIGITVVSAAAGAFGGATFGKELEPVLARWGVGAYAAEASLAVVIILVSYLSLVLGELVPKSLALKASEPYALFMARPLRWLSVIAGPVVWFLTVSSNVVLRVFRDRTNFMESRVSPDELQQLVQEAAKTGAVHPRAGEIASRAIAFAELSVANVMVPRGDVVALRRGASLDEVRSVLLEQTHSRFPVYERTIDRVVGYISAKDVLAMAWEERLFVLEDLIRPAYYVPKVSKAVEVLKEMQQRRVPFAIVVDELGGMDGIVTMEDLLEELVGEIFSEHAARAPERIRREADGSFVVDAEVPVRELNRELGTDLPEDPRWTTVGGLCVTSMAHIPEPGEALRLGEGKVIEVLSSSPRRVKTLRLRLPDRATAAPPGRPP